MSDQPSTSTSSPSQIGAAIPQRLPGRSGPRQSTRTAVGPEGRRRDVDVDGIHEARVQRRAVQRGRPLRARRTHTPDPQRAKRRAQYRRLAGQGCGRPRPSEPRRAFGRRGACALATDDYDRPGVERREHPGRRRRPQPPIEDDPGQRPRAVGAAGVSRGSSVSTVPDPTPIASTSARCRWTRRLAAGPVSRVRVPGAPRAARPGSPPPSGSRAAARSADVGQEHGVLPRRGGPLHADDDLDAGLAQVGAGRAPCTSGLGSSIAITARRMPASTTTRRAGPVRPVCEHGSSVQYSVAPRARTAGVLERDRLRRAARRRLVRAPADDHPVVVDDQRADHRIRAGRPRPRSASASALRMKSSDMRLPLLFEQRVDVLLGRKRDQVVDALRRRRRSGSAASDRARSRRRCPPWRCHRASSGRCR